MLDNIKKAEDFFLTNFENIEFTDIKININETIKNHVLDITQSTKADLLKNLND